LFFQGSSFPSFYSSSGASPILRGLFFSYVSNLFLFLNFLILPLLDLSGVMQSLMAQHSQLLLQTQLLDNSLTQYCRLLSSFARDFQLMHVQHGSATLVGLGLAESVADVDAFADFLRNLELDQDDIAYATRLSAAQDAYSRLVSFLGPVLPSLMGFCGASSSATAFVSPSPSPEPAPLPASVSPAPASAASAATLLPATGALSTTPAVTPRAATVALPSTPPPVTPAPRSFRSRNLAEVVVPPRSAHKRTPSVGKPSSKAQGKRRAE
jgi:hypothetical protein